MITFSAAYRSRRVGLREDLRINVQEFEERRISGRRRENVW